MPETKKYLNRDGLEEYNSLLPHSSTEIQEYVNDWLDAHPEATTTVQDGSITTQKLADGSVTRNKLAADVAHLLGGMMVTGEVQGEILAADDAYSVAPLSMEIDGKSTQDGTPTPENPVPIESIEVLELPVTFAGKNLCPTANGSDIAGTWTRSGSNYFYYPKVNLDNGSATLSCLMTAASGSSSAIFRLYIILESDAGQVVVQRYCDLNHAGELQKTVTGTGTLRLGLNATAANNETVMALLKNIQLELGSTATDYEPYAGITTNIPMQGHVLRSLPDRTHDTMTLSYLRESDRAGRAWYSRELVQRIDKHTFNGSENWSGGNSVAYNGATGTNRYNTQIANLRRAPTVAMRDCLMSDVLMHTSTNIWSTPDNFIWYTVVNDNQVHIVFDNATIGVTAETGQADRTTAIKAWLAENPITIDYPLATPITTQLDPIELPVLPAPNCTVWSDPTTGLKMSYMRDANIVVSNIEQAIADL